MNGLYRAAQEIQNFMAARNWRFCIIGGLAVVRWGEPRATADVDITLLAGFGEEQRYIDELLAAFPVRIEDAADFALRNRVLLLSATNGVPVDVALGGIPFEELLIEHATPFEFTPGLQLITCSAEDLVVLKAFAGRPRDMADVQGIVARQGVVLDWEYIIVQLEPLCELKGDTDTLQRLNSLRRMGK